LNTSRPLVVFETICHQLIARLEGDASERGSAFTAEAKAFLATLEGWQQRPPTQAQRSDVIAKVMDLHRTAMEYVTVSGGGSTEM
jgi:hypothetical protein